MRWDINCKLFLSSYKSVLRIKHIFLSLENTESSHVHILTNCRETISVIGWFVELLEKLYLKLPAT